MSTHVEKEAIAIVKNALATFKQGLEGSAQRIKEITNDLINEGGSQLQETNQEISHLTSLIQQLEKQIVQFQTQVQKIKRDIQEVSSQIQYLERSNSDLEKKIKNIDTKIRKLELQLSSTVESEQRSLLQKCINELQEEKQHHTTQILKNNRQCQDNRRKIEKFNHQIALLKSDISQKEQLSKKESQRRNKYINKLERQKIEFHKVQEACISLYTSLKNFENKAKDSTSKSTSSIERCLQSIQEYEKVNLST